MELRKHVSKPVRFDEDYDAHETPRASTKPAFRKMMAARIIPFNPNNPPAAFPSLPLDRSFTLPAAGTCPDTLSGFIPRSISEGVSTTAISSSSCTSPVLEQDNHTVEVAQHPNGPPILSQVQMSVECLSRAPEETFPGDGHAFSDELWVSLPLSLQYHIYKRMPIFYPDQNSLDLLGLTDSQFDDLVSIARVRREMEFTEVQLWNICARTSAFCDGDGDTTAPGCVSELGNETLSALNLRNTVGSFTPKRETFSATAPLQQDFRSSPTNDSARLPVEPEILTQNLEQLVLASNYELAYEVELNRAECFLLTRHVSTAVLGTWVPDGAIGDESEFFTFLPGGSSEHLAWLNGYSTALQITDPGYVPSWKRGWPSWQPTQPSQSTSLVAQNPYMIKGSTGGNVPLAQQHESPLRNRKIPAGPMSSEPQSLTVASTTNDRCIHSSPILSPPDLPESVAIISPSTHESNSITIQGDYAASSVGGILQAQRGMRETEGLTLSRGAQDEEAVTTNSISPRVLHISFLTLKFKNLSEFRQIFSGTASESPNTPERQGMETSAAFISLKYTPTKSMKRARARSLTTDDRPTAATAPSTPRRKEYPGSPFRSTTDGVRRKRTISNVEASPTEISKSSRPTKRLNNVGFPMSLEMSQFTTLLPIPPIRARQKLQSQVNPQPALLPAPVFSHRIKPLSATSSSQTTSRPLEFAAELFMPLRQPSCSPIPENKGNDEIEAFLARHAAPIRFNTQTGVVHTEQTRVQSTNQNSQSLQ